MSETQAAIDTPRCAFHPQGLGKRCENDAIFAVVSPTEKGSFFYFPCCDKCLEEAGELRDNNFILAHLYGQGDDDDS